MLAAGVSVDHPFVQLLMDLADSPLQLEPEGEAAGPGGERLSEAYHHFSASLRLLEEVEADSQHPLRLRFDQLVAEFIRRLKTDPGYRAAAERMLAVK